MSLIPSGIAGSGSQEEGASLTWTGGHTTGEGERERNFITLQDMSGILLVNQDCFSCPLTHNLNLMQTLSSNIRSTYSMNLEKADVLHCWHTYTYVNM